MKPVQASCINTMPRGKAILSQTANVARDYYHIGDRHQDVVILAASSLGTVGGGGLIKVTSLLRVFHNSLRHSVLRGEI